MNFSDKIRELRKAYGLSQEKLAEKLNVSRQAVTKWESSAGYPETETLIAIAELFRVSIDELLLTAPLTQAPRYLYESRTVYDIDRKKKFDINIGAVNSIEICCSAGEKLEVKLASDSIRTITTDLKLKLDDIKSRTDVDLCRYNNLTEAETKNKLDVFITVPSSLSSKIELTASARQLKICDVDKIEFDGKADRIILENTRKAEINCGSDVDINCKNFGTVEVNQICCMSRLGVTKDAVFRTDKKGLRNSIYFEENSQRCEPFACPQAESEIKLNGIKSELIIYRQ